MVGWISTQAFIYEDSLDDKTPDHRIFLSIIGAGLDLDKKGNGCLIVIIIPYLSEVEYPPERECNMCYEVVTVFKQIHIDYVLNNNHLNIKNWLVRDKFKRGCRPQHLCNRWRY